MIVFALTVFLGAFLLFQVQPLLARYFLPWFGGTTAVWTTCLLFFQTLLLAGYAYAHGLVQRFNLRNQVGVHLVLLGVSLVALAISMARWGSPLLPGCNLKATDWDWPSARLLGLLLTSVGLPYFMLSSTSPLAQSWFGGLRSRVSVYRLYMLSNIGSLLALLSYPLLFEPQFKLSAQANIWALGYLLFVACFAACAVKTTKCAADSATEGAGQDAPAGRRPAEPAPIVPGAGARWLWLGLSACGSILLLATTNQMCQEIAVVPFLWILPLSLYLLSMIVCFGHERFYARNIFFLALILAMILVCWMLHYDRKLAIQSQVGGYALVLFVGCMVCHGELFRLKPDPRRLTSFYLAIALGGALGGAFVALLAPLLFNGFWEFHIGLFACGLLLLLALLHDRHSWAYRGIVRPWALAANLLILGAFLLVHALDTQRNCVYTLRNFYGVLRVTEKFKQNPARHKYELKHGMILHGFQLIEGRTNFMPGAYYNVDSGIGLALRYHPRRLAREPLRIGIIGLGAGMLAAYGRPGDTFCFYEINPEVIALARGQGGFFSYLRDCPATVEIVRGDARLALERELAQGRPRGFDVLAVDAFSSDAIPVHLLTLEAWEIYRKHLRPDGILALHISNRYLDLYPVVLRVARRLQMPSVLIKSPFDYDKGYNRAVWLLATGNTEFLSLPEVAMRNARNRNVAMDVPPWTDQFSNLLEVLR